MGNQMFQFAAAYAKAKEFKMGLKIDLSYLESNAIETQSFTPRQFQLDAFKNTLSYINYQLNAQFDIPENQKNFLDIGVIHPHLVNKLIPQDSVVAIQYKEVLEASEIRFVPEFHSITRDNKLSFHKIVDFSLLDSDLQVSVLQNIKDIVAAICV